MKNVLEKEMYVRDDFFEDPFFDDYGAETLNLLATNMPPWKNKVYVTVDEHPNRAVFVRDRLRALLNVDHTTINIKTVIEWLETGK